MEIDFICKSGIWNFYQITDVKKKIQIAVNYDNPSNEKLIQIYEDFKNERPNRHIR